MKISDRQIQAVVRSWRHDPPPEGDLVPESSKTSDGADMAELAAKVRDMPDVRDIVVFPLKSRLRRGTYYVPGLRIVDELLGRLAANLLKR